MGEYWNDLEIVEIPDDLDSQLMGVDFEESKSQASVQEIDNILSYIDNRVAYKDELLTVYPVLATSTNGKKCYSFYGLPAKGNGKFLP